MRIRQGDLMQKAKLIKQSERRGENASARTMSGRESRPVSITYETTTAVREWVQRYRATQNHNPRADFAALFAA
jgi:hypothetical protein